eukprot:7468909-Pyramimonas_sp.AAC.1
MKREDLFPDGLPVAEVALDLGHARAKPLDAREYASERVIARSRRCAARHVAAHKMRRLGRWS